MQNYVSSIFSILLQTDQNGTKYHIYAYYGILLVPY